MKRLLGPALFLFVVGGVVAWYALAASLRSEREYTAWVHALADDESTRVLESRFERGWLHSRAETSIEMSGGAGLAFRAFVTALGAVDVRERVGLHMVHGIEHGPLPLWEWLRAGMEGAPVLARIRSTVEIDHESQRELAEAIGKLPPVEAETVVRAAGHAATHLSVAAQRLRASGEGFARDARFLGASGDLEFRDRYRHLSGTLQSPGFAGRGLERAVELRDVTWLFELPGSELPVGRMELGVGELRVAPAAGDGGLTLADVLLEPSGRVSGGRLEADLRLRVRSVALGAEAFGPATVALDLRDLDAAALRRLRRAGLSLQEGQTDPVATAVAAGELAEALPALLDRGPRAELRELRLATPAGPIAARGRLALARPDLSSGSLSVGSFFDAELDAEAPAAAAESILASLVTPARVRELREKGALAADGERARLRVEWRGGSLQLNGVSVPLPTPAPAPAPAAAGPGAAPAAQAAAAGAPEARATEPTAGGAGTASGAQAATVTPEAGATESAAETAPVAEREPAADTASGTSPAGEAAPVAPTGSATPAESVPAAPAPAAVESAPAAPAP